MAKKNTQAPEPGQKAMLIVSRDEAERRLQTQIDKGNEFLSRPILTTADLEATGQEHTRWGDFNYDLLRASSVPRNPRNVIGCTA